MVMMINMAFHVFYVYNRLKGKNDYKWSDYSFFDQMLVKKMIGMLSKKEIALSKWMCFTRKWQFSFKIAMEFEGLFHGTNAT